jgi:cytochrome P450
MTEPALTLENFNPFSPDHLSEPAAGWELLRREAPVYRLALPGPVPVFAVSRKRDIEDIGRRTEVFSSNPVPTVWRWGAFEPAIAEVFDKSGYKVVYTLQASDPPMSLQYRRIAEEALNRKKIIDLQPEITAIIDRLMAAIPSDQPFNFVDAFSVPLPLQVICLILGIPYDDMGFIKFFSDEFTHLVDPAHSLERAVKAAETVAEGYKYLARYMEIYAQAPADNLLSAIAHAEIDGRPLSIDERLSMAHTLTIAGNETTRNALSSAMFMLASRPDIWARLNAEPAKIPDFIEEVLRIHAPAATTPRLVLEDTVFQGVSMPKGSAVFLLWASAGHDDETFENPLEIDLDRKNKRSHITFGMGVHHCVGSFLARAELTAAVSRWLNDFAKVELAVPLSQVRYDPVFGFHSLSDLPIRVTRFEAALAAA